MKQREIEAAAVHLRLCLAGIAVSFDASFHELEEITKRALLEVGSSREESTGDNEIVWIKAWNQNNEVYEKALEKDQKNSTAYVTLVNNLLEKRDEGKKGMVLGDKWYFLSSDGDFVGRKPKKEFGKRT